MVIVILIFILIVVGIAWYLLSHDRGAKEPVGALWVAGGFGVAAVIAAAVLESVVIPSGFLAGTLTCGAALVPALAIGAIEETLKFLPLAWFIYRKPYFNEYTDGIIYFALCGLAFGLIENVIYTMQYGTKTGLARIVLIPFFHSAATGTAGYYLVRTKLKAKPFGGVVAAVAILAVLHGLYDFGLASQVIQLAVLSIMITVLLSVGLFLYFQHATELDERLGLSTVGVNKFCRACGRPNANHTLYCEHCGKPA